MRAKLRQKRKEAGVALLIVLVALALLSVLVLGFLSSMTTELGVSSAIEKTHRTKLLADGALAHAIDTLRTNIPDPTTLDGAINGRPVNWVTNPGRLTLIDGGNVEHIDLHTGSVSAIDETRPPDSESVDLNRPIPGNGVGPIAMDPESDERPEMRIKWKPVLKDPTRPAARDNKIRGRYAFWIDDESTKVNVSVALGKREQAPWKEQLDLGFPTPQVMPSESHQQLISLGHPSTINAAVLFEDPADVDIGMFFFHQYLHGFHRYPDSVMRFTNLNGTDAREWMVNRRWNFSFYNRAPEFNIFGEPRLFAMHQPGSLDAGPAYQQPFTVNRGGTIEPRFQGILGSPGFNVDNEEVTADQLEEYNSITKAMGRQISRYFQKKWPDFSGGGTMNSLTDKYGREETTQIILNMMMLSRLATTPFNGSDDPRPFHEKYADLVTSLNHRNPNPKDPEDKTARIPEDDYWMLDGDFNTKNGANPMLPQTPGPHMNEIKFVVTPEEFFDPDDDFKRKFRIQYHYEVEYYMHPFGPQLQVNPFPAKVDFLKMKATGVTMEIDDKNWDSEEHRKLIAEPAGSIAPTRPGDKGDAIGDISLNYRVASSQAFYLADGDSVTDDETDAAVFEPDDDVKLELKLRVGLAGPGPRCKQVVPMGTEEDDSLEETIEIDLRNPNDDYFVNWEVEDPRVSWSADDWELAKPGEDTMGKPNSIQPQEYDAPEYAKFKTVQVAAPGSTYEGFPLEVGSEMRYGGRIPSQGMWSLVHTGIQERKPWQTLSLAPSDDQQEEPPDWVVLDLFGPAYPMPRHHWATGRSIPDTWSAMSYLNATAGKVNLNTRIYPDDSTHFDVPDRSISIEAVFSQFRPEYEIAHFADTVEDYQDTDEVFDYVGELAEVKGCHQGDTDWEKESFIRNMAGSLTTKSNTFGVWGIAQTVRKAPSNYNYDEFEWGDGVMGERRFYALVERHVWPGKDGLPGNAHTNSRGIWDRLAEGASPGPGVPPVNDRIRKIPGAPPNPPSPGGKFAEIDGPTRVGMEYAAVLPDVPYQKRVDSGAESKTDPSSLADAYNPADAVMKYRILYFKYLDH